MKSITLSIFFGAVFFVITNATSVHDVTWDYVPSYSISKPYQGSDIPSDFLPYNTSEELRTLPVNLSVFCTQTCKAVGRNYSEVYMFGGFYQKTSITDPNNCIDALRCSGDPTAVFISKSGDKYTIYYQVSTRREPMTGKTPTTPRLI